MLRLVTVRLYQQTGILSPEMKMLFYYYITYNILIHQKELQLKNQHTENKVTLITKCFSEEIQEVEYLTMAMP